MIELSTGQYAISAKRCQNGNSVAKMAMNRCQNGTQQKKTPKENPKRERVVVVPLGILSRVRK